MVWAGITFNGTTPLIFVQGNVTGINYRHEMLQPVVEPYGRQYNLTLQEVNARPHTARVNQDMLEQGRVEVLLWSSFWPDVSPIEHLWDQLNTRI